MNALHCHRSPLLPPLTHVFPGTRRGLQWLFVLQASDFHRFRLILLKCHLVSLLCATMAVVFGTSLSVLADLFCEFFFRRKYHKTVVFYARERCVPLNHILFPSSTRCRFFTQAPAGQARYVVVSGYVQVNTGSGKTATAGGQVGARPETQADVTGIVGKDTGTPPSLEVKKRPKKGLFRGVFGSSKALSKVGGLAPLLLFIAGDCFVSRCDSFASFVVGCPSLDSHGCVMSDVCIFLLRVTQTAVAPITSSQRFSRQPWDFETQSEANRKGDTGSGRFFPPTHPRMHAMSSRQKKQQLCALVGLCHVRC